MYITIMCIGKFSGSNYLEIIFCQRAFESRKFDCLHFRHIIVSIFSHQIICICRIHGEIIQFNRNFTILYFFCYKMILSICTLCCRSETFSSISLILRIIGIVYGCSIGSSLYDCRVCFDVISSCI